VGEQQHVLHRHRRALHRHQPFGLGAPCIGIAVHVGEGKAGHDNRRRERDADTRARNVALDLGPIVAVGEAVGAQPLAHRRCQVRFVELRAQHRKAPRLPVVGGRREPRCVEQAFDGARRQRLGPIVADRAAPMHPAGEHLRGRGFQQGHGGASAEQV
jgi:hypothetical protein